MKFSWYCSEPFVVISAIADETGRAEAGIQSFKRMNIKALDSGWNRAGMTVEKKFCCCTKENNVDERMMTLFSLIADQVRERKELFDEEGKIMQALLNNGCRLHEADAALTLAQTIVQSHSEDFFPAAANSSVGMRTMNREERSRFTVDAFGFVSKLTNLGVMGEDQREELLERAMAVYPERIELDQIKSLVASTLLVHPQDQDVNVPSAGRRIRNTSWN